MPQETVSVDYASKNIFMPVQRMIKRRKRLSLIPGFPDRYIYSVVLCES